jgi:2-keto-4-pentenoate hydratase/2-oxohepta-3-ene-1,7-dioic acid hydratase in catechol pathway
MPAYVAFESGIGRLAPDGTVHILECPYADLGRALRAGVTAAGAGGMPVRDVVDLSSIHLHAPVTEPGKIVAIGLNYLAHVEEAGSSRPEQPTLFLKAPSSIIGPGAPIRLPAVAPTRVDYEGEIALVIGTKGKNIDAKSSWDHVFGVTICNDVSARDVQLGAAGGKPNVSLAKSFDTFTPMGPRVVTTDDLADRDNIVISTYVNGQLRQHASTNQLLVSIPEIVAYASTLFTLHPGDVILTGTPAGVGYPQGLFLRFGDTVSIEVDGIGILENSVLNE